MTSAHTEKGEKMPIKGEQQGYTYKALINGEWQEVTIQESPLELMERFEQDEEWTRVRHGHWTNIKISVTGNSSAECSQCGTLVHDSFADVDRLNYCPHCGAKMEESTSTMGQVKPSDGERKEDGNKPKSI